MNVACRGCQEETMSNGHTEIGNKEIGFMYICKFLFPKSSLSKCE